MSSSAQQKINEMLHKLRIEKQGGAGGHPQAPPRPQLNLGLGAGGSPIQRRPRNLAFAQRQTDDLETERRLREITKISGDVTLDGTVYKTEVKDMEDVEELGNGTCGHVVKMKHGPSGSLIAVKQMRRSGNSDENKRIIMDIEVVLQSHDCQFIVQCLGCFITETEVWICMELMDTCFDKLLRRLGKPIPENVLGKVTVATVEALSYLKDKHGVIHRDVKPSNILLDNKGNVKLCDFGISGRLVDSMAKTRSAGCAAYMAPERIEPDPNNPDYDVRADVWSLGISLVEMATGVFPYQDCKTDFEVLTKVIGQEPPRLPSDKGFSNEFRNFIACCLIKDKKHRPKYAKLKGLPFIRNYETADVNVGDWYRKALAPPADEPSGDPGSGPRPHNPPRQFFAAPAAPPAVHPHQPPPPSDAQRQLYARLSLLHRPDPQQNNRNSRLGAFQQNEAFSPLRAYQNHVESLRREWEPSSPVPQRRMGADGVTKGPAANRSHSETRWHSPSGSPLPLRSQLANEDQRTFNCGNTSPIVLQRFYHQQKQQQMAKEAEESGGKKRFASYIKLQLGGAGRTSRHQSPEPPPRAGRPDGQSPLAARRAAEASSPATPRRYVSPAPPVPPPRRLSESASVPGSPQHVRARFHYTPEPQRRPFRAGEPP